jgi:NADH-quinone oxidoreductase subunit G
VSQAIYRVDALVRRAQALQAHPLNAGPRVSLHPDDAAASGLGQGAMAKVAGAAGTATLPVNVTTLVAPGCAWIESGYGPTAGLGAGRVKVEAA